MIIIFLLGALLTATMPLQAAQKRIQITEGMIKADPIAVHPFTAPDENISGTIAQVINNDLYNCGLFAPLKADLFPQKSPDIQTNGIKFDLWKNSSARFVVSGHITYVDDKLNISFYLYDILSETRILAQAIEGPKDNWRRLAHAVADLIYTRITNEVGFFNTQIVYAKSHGQGRARNTQLMKMDYDGENPTSITNKKNLVLTPRYSPDGKSIAYLKIEKHHAAVYVMNLETKESERLGQFEGMSYAPRFSPDGKTIVMSLAKNGSSAIYTMDLQTHTLKRLTDHRSIDTTPCYSPDGQSIVFTSDRSGQEKIYIMDTNGGNVQRISHGEGKYSEPVWSPRGDLIAFTKQARTPDGVHFYIGVMATDGSGERMISNAWLVEDPCWAGNGRYLLFTRQTSSREEGKLAMIDLTGYNQRMIKTNGGATNGVWSPLKIVN